MKKIKDLKFLKDAMDLRVDKMTEIIEKHCLPKILNVALFKYNVNDLERGAYFFSEKPGFSTRYL